MASVIVSIALANNNQSRIDLTYDDVTLQALSLAWVNPVGVWTVTLTRQPSGQQITRTLQPGDSGSLNFPNGWTWGTDKGHLANFDMSTSWTP